MLEFNTKDLEPFTTKLKQSRRVEIAGFLTSLWLIKVAKLPFAEDPSGELKVILEVLFEESGSSVLLAELVEEYIDKVPDEKIPEIRQLQLKKVREKLEFVKSFVDSKVDFATSSLQEFPKECMDDNGTINQFIEAARSYQDKLDNKILEYSCLFQLDHLEEEIEVALERTRELTEMILQEKKEFGSKVTKFIVQQNPHQKVNGTSFSFEGRVSVRMDITTSCSQSERVS